jgi:D-glycero-alpha-D-manno-heptose 1-phosphate guanylyltransferase
VNKEFPLQSPVSSLQPPVNDIDVIILCGGKGTRLHSVVNDRPKSMALINGKPFLFYLLKQVSFYGFKKVILCIGYKGDMIKDYFGDKILDLNILYSLEMKPLGTGGAIRLALPKISSDYILVMNGDSYIDVNLNEFINWGYSLNIEAGILLTKVENISRYGRVTVDNRLRIESFNEKGLNSGAGLINAGIYLLKKNVLMSVPVNKVYSMEKQFFPHLVSKKKMCGLSLAGQFIDIGTPKSYADGDKFFKSLYSTSSTDRQIPKSPNLQKTLSICMIGRNDNYSPDFKRRFVQSVNFLAYSAEKAGVLDDIEVLITDWNSDIPLYEELSFSESAVQILKFIIVPPKVAKKHNWKNTPFHTTKAANVALRRANGKYLAFMPGDILITSLVIEQLIRLLTGRIKSFFEPEKTLMSIPRKLIPQKFDDATEWSKGDCSNIDKMLFFMSHFLKTDYIGAGDCAGGGVFIFNSDNIKKINGLDEKFGGWGWTDRDLALRISRDYPVVNLAGYGMSVYDFEPHYGFMRTKYSRYNYIKLFHQKINDNKWGLQKVDLKIVNCKKQNSPTYENKTYDFIDVLKINIQRKNKERKKFRLNYEIVRNRPIENYYYSVSGFSIDLLLLELIFPKNVNVKYLDICSNLSSRYLLTYLNPFCDLYFIPPSNSDASVKHDYLTETLFDLRFHYGLVRCIPSEFNIALKNIKEYFEKKTQIFEIIRFNCEFFKRKAFLTFKTGIYDILKEKGVLVFYGDKSSYNSFISDLASDNMDYTMIKWNKLYAGLLIKTTGKKEIIDSEQLIKLVSGILRRTLQDKTPIYIKISRKIFFLLWKISLKLTQQVRKGYEHFLNDPCPIYVKITRKIFFLAWKILLKQTKLLRKAYDYFIPSVTILD